MTINGYLEYNRPIAQSRSVSSNDETTVGSNECVNTQELHDNAVPATTNADQSQDLELVDDVFWGDYVTKL